MTFSQLATFLAVARAGSVTGAAEVLVVTQPSVSAAVSALSREVGVELTERIGRNIRLTSAGQEFLPFAVDVLGLLEVGKRAAHVAAKASALEVRIAAVTTAGEYLLPPLLQAFSLRHPEIGLTLEVANRRSVFQRVLDHSSDVAIAGRPPVSGGRLDGRRFLRNDLAVIAPMGDLLARRRSVPVEELADRTWLLREEGSGTRTMVEEFLSHNDARPTTLTLGSNGAIKQAVRIGLGLSLQSRIAVELELESGVLATIDVEGGLPTRHWYVLRSGSGPPRPPVQAFFDFVTTEAHGAIEAAHPGADVQAARP
ncbi:MAG TPA: LysR family transcriptional regulator [Gaiellaceae bacterium]|nr:LysR family transcriptional regulator [Gaiellaceae bacterium]